MRPRHAVPLTPSKATRLSHPSCGAEHSFRTTNPLPAAHYCLKSFSCNTYGSPRKCCKQKTYGLTKPFRCSTYKKHGARGLSDSRTRQSSLATGLKSFFFKFLRALLRFFLHFLATSKKSTPFLSCNSTLFHEKQAGGGAFF